MSSLAAAVAAMEALVARDIGGRGIASLVVPGDLLGAANALVSSVAGVAIFTGFPCVVGHEVPTENDGLAGAVAIARAALCLGKPRVVLVTDECNRGCVAAGRAWLCGLGQSVGKDWEARISVLALPSVAEGWGPPQEALMAELAEGCDHYVAIERAGRAADGSYYTMRGRALDALVAPVDDAFGRCPSTTGIGDGGNELG